ncbi:MAG TPA: DoxX family protein [Polyangiaceae bacterium]|nr:DoxX family protein [Polyangiaceae bacterium]
MMIRATRDFWRRVLESDAPRATVLVRCAVGVIFASEGIQKFLYPDALGVGRFTRIGIPAPQLLAPFVGIVEIVCGALICVGLLVRLAAVPLMIDMLVAIVATKLPILLGHGVLFSSGAAEPALSFAAPSGSRFGLWSMLHEARTDLAMLLGCTFLLLAGAGVGALDGVLLRRERAAWYRAPWRGWRDRMRPHHLSEAGRQ